MRVYPAGELVIRFSPALAAGCRYNDHTYTPATAASYKLISSLAMLAHATRKSVYLIYSGCDANNGNVNLMGLIVN